VGKLKKPSSLFFFKHLCSISLRQDNEELYNTDSS
jgi:hypothetical protein